MKPQLTTEQYIQAMLPPSKFKIVYSVDDGLRQVIVTDHTFSEAIECFLLMFQDLNEGHIISIDKIDILPE